MEVPGTGLPEWYPRLICAPLDDTDIRYGDVAVRSERLGCVVAAAAAATAATSLGVLGIDPLPEKYIFLLKFQGNPKKWSLVYALRQIYATMFKT